MYSYTGMYVVGDSLLLLTGKNLMRLDRGVRLKYYSRDDPTLAELVDKLDETVFTAVLYNDDYVIRYILPDRRRNSYCPRPKRHYVTLITRRDSRNFFPRLLFKYIY